MSKDVQHSTEEWYYHDYSEPDESPVFAIEAVGRKDPIIVCVHETTDTTDIPQLQADWKHIIEVHNACRPIKNPLETVPKLIALARWAHMRSEATRGCSWFRLDDILADIEPEGEGSVLEVPGAYKPNTEELPEETLRRLHAGEPDTRSETQQWMDAIHPPATQGEAEPECST